MAKASRSYSNSVAVVKKGVKAALIRLGMQIAKQTETEIHVEVSTSIFSWGEQMRIVMKKELKRTLVEVESEAVAQLVDW